MEKTLATILVIFALFIGVCGGAIFTPAEVEYQDKIVNHTINVTEYIDVDVPTVDTSLLLDDSVEDFLTEVEDSRTLRKCSGDRYSFDEISISDIGDKYIIVVNDEDTTVKFKVELRYKESDIRSCYDVYDVEAYYEDEEDVVIDY